MVQLFGTCVYATLLAYLYALNPTVAVTVAAVTIAAALIKGSK